MMSVYFMQDKETGLIKIGTSKRTGLRRFRIQRACHGELELLGLIPGGRAEEAELHRKFAKYRFSGEWFRPRPELVDYINDVTGRLNVTPEEIEERRKLGRLMSELVTGW